MFNELLNQNPSDWFIFSSQIYIFPATKGPGPRYATCFHPLGRTFSMTAMQKVISFFIVAIIMSVIMLWCKDYTGEWLTSRLSLRNVYWQSEPNPTMLRSVPHVKDHKHIYHKHIYIKPYELSKHAEFDLHIMKECSTKQLSECITCTPGD